MCLLHYALHAIDDVESAGQSVQGVAEALPHEVVHAALWGGLRHGLGSDDELADCCDHTLLADAVEIDGGLGGLLLIVYGAEPAGEAA